MRTLVASPTGSAKAYCFEQWALATNGYDRLVAVCEPDYKATAESLHVPVVMYKKPDDRKGIYGPMFTAAWTAILARAWDYTHILSLETDVIPPFEWDILEIMEDEYKPDFTAHGVPWRDCDRYAGRDTLCYEMGCTIFSVETLRRAIALCPSDRGLYCVTSDAKHFRKHCIDVVELAHVSESAT